MECCQSRYGTLAHHPPQLERRLVREGGLFVVQLSGGLILNGSGEV
jgi:hypothetical protein